MCDTKRRRPLATLLSFYDNEIKPRNKFSNFHTSALTSHHNKKEILLEFYCINNKRNMKYSWHRDICQMPLFMVSPILRGRINKSLTAPSDAGNGRSVTRESFVAFPQNGVPQPNVSIFGRRREMTRGCARVQGFP